MMRIIKETGRALRLARADKARARSSQGFESRFRRGVDATTARPEAARPSSPFEPSVLFERGLSPPFRPDRPRSFGRIAFCKIVFFKIAPDRFAAEIGP